MITINSLLSWKNIRIIHFSILNKFSPLGNDNVAVSFDSYPMILNYLEIQNSQQLFFFFFFQKSSLVQKKIKINRKNLKMMFGIKYINIFCALRFYWILH